MGFWDDDERREHAQLRFEERMAIPVLVAAALLTAVTLVLLFGDPSGGARVALIAVDVTIWAFFVIEYCVRLVVTPHKRRFVRREWLDLVLVVLPVFQPARLVGAFVRLARLSAAVGRARRGADRLLRRHKLHLALAWAIGLVMIAAVVTPIVEPTSSKIKGFGDGVWWSLVTTTTVGYGDLVPESTTGRIIGALLMVVGISIIGLITANIASLFIEPADRDTDAAAGEDEQSLPGQPTSLSLEERLERIERKLDLLTEQSSGQPG